MMKIFLAIISMFLITNGNAASPEVQSMLDQYTQANGKTQQAMKAKNYGEACKAAVLSCLCCVA
jgi:hypothetical protein